jgi:hypothetical protein
MLVQESERIRIKKINKEIEGEKKGQQVIYIGAFRHFSSFRHTARDSRSCSSKRFFKTASLHRKICFTREAICEIVLAGAGALPNGP